MREKKKFVCVCKKQDDIGGTGAGRLGETKGLGQRENDKNLEGEGPGTLLVIDVGNELDRDGVEHLSATCIPDAFLSHSHNLRFSVDYTRVILGTCNCVPLGSREL